MREDYLIARLKRWQEEQPNLFNQQVVEIFGRLLSWHELEQKNHDEHSNLETRLKKELQLQKSPYDILKLSKAIQKSRSGLGLAALTPFICTFCNKEEIWANSNTPLICSNCSYEMALKIIVYRLDLLKS